MTNNKVSITLPGKQYKVRCPVGKESELQLTAQRLSERLEQTKRKAGLTTREDIIMMTALNMCHQELQFVDRDDQSTGQDAGDVTATQPEKY